MSQETSGLAVEFRPGRLIARSTRQTFTAEELNRIGNLLPEHERLVIILELLPQIIESVDKTLRELGRIPFQGDVDGVAADVEIEDLVEQQGVLLQRLHTAQSERKQQLETLLNELRQLGVVRLRSGLHGAAYVDTAI